jgi:hypothetical protein
MKLFAVNPVGIKLKVDNQDIQMNNFVAKFIQGTIMGSVSSLKGLNDNWEKIEIEITKA